MARREEERSPSRTTALEDLQNSANAASLSKQITRRFVPGDVYAPHDLSWVEMQKWKTRGRPTYDALDALDLKPLDHYRVCCLGFGLEILCDYQSRATMLIGVLQNFSMISEYMTPMGRIKHSNETGLRPVNQRRMARTIRRTIGMGIMPSVHRHPEVLLKIMKKSQSAQNAVRGMPV